MFNFAFILLHFLRKLITPVAVLMSSKLKSRLEFERSFQLAKAHSGDNAPLACFEVASEGELEQVLPVMNELLKDGHVLELLFVSDSLKNKVERLKEQWGSNLRIICFPLISSYMPGGAALSKFIQAKNLVFCRYDFFPEWVSLATHRQSFLLSAVLTEKKRGGFLKGLFLRWLLSRFSKIYAASGEDADRITELGLTSEVCVADFRFEQIFNRQLVANETLEGSDLLGPYLTSLEQVPKEQRLIFGSAHPQDLSALLGESLKKFLDSGGHLYVAPHHLDTNRVDNLVEQFKDFFGPEVIVCSNDWDGKGSLHGKVFVGTFKGVLCEMYPRFSKAYVGGGFLKSVHSVSEAFMGECLVSLGPVHHRSSEYRFIKKVYPERITVLHHEKDLSSWLGRDSLEYTYSYPWQEQMSSLVDQNKALRSDLVKRLQLTQ